MMMYELFIEPTKSTPSVHFDPKWNRLWISGESYPENAFKFYEPLLRWVDEYLEQLGADQEVLLELRLPYVNTSSTKCFMMLLEKFDAAHASGKHIKLVWYCSPDNESEQECAEEFKEDLSLPFDIVLKEEA
ncbi:protein of unknown function [Paenibacillus sp. UNCCL117]|nr:protein of unknown function [Paenibacillus sp. cl123]SFW35301.1 protein of unknown function [Paenibacillus sp. UNCCL117]